MASILEAMTSYLIAMASNLRAAEHCRAGSDLWNVVDRSDWLEPSNPEEFCGSVHQFGRVWNVLEDHSCYDSCWSETDFGTFTQKHGLSLPHFWHSKL